MSWDAKVQRCRGMQAERREQEVTGGGAEEKRCRNRGAGVKRCNAAEEQVRSR